MEQLQSVAALIAQDANLSKQASAAQTSAAESQPAYAGATAGGKPSANDDDIVYVEVQ